MIYLSRKSSFCAAHRYYDEKLTLEENVAQYGKCANTHGHNYQLEVTVAGEADTTTGMVINLSQLDAIIKEQVIELLDHKNIQDDVPEFKTMMPTTELIARFIWRQLDGHLDVATLYRVRLYEDDSLFVDCYGEDEGC